MTEARFSELMASVDRSKLHGHLAGILRRPEDREDAIQDGFLRAWRFADRWTGESSWSTWVYRVVINSARTILRTHVSRRHRAQVSLDESFHPADHAPNIEQRLIARDREAVGQRFLNLLRSSEREAFQEGAPRSFSLRRLRAKRRLLKIARREQFAANYRKTAKAIA